jgi:hypothetical protein
MPKAKPLFKEQILAAAIFDFVLAWAAKICSLDSGFAFGNSY